MSLPEVTHLQFLVLGALKDSELPGRLLRDVLAEHGARKSLAAFYQLMMRLEDAGFVAGWYEQQVVDSQLLKERHYKITAAGVAAWQSVVDFYGTVPN